MDTADIIGNARLCGVQGSVVVGVSGGPDSMALLRGMASGQEELGIRITVAHFDHALRDASVEDARWIRALGEELGLPVVVERRDVRKHADQSGRGLEETARDLRYDFLKRVAAESSAEFVAVGHHADDQAETVLHHILRGTGLSGLAGMQITRPLDSKTTLVRPLLAYSRQQIETYLADIGQRYLTDASNEDSRFTRNRIRNELLPLLETQFNPRVSEALARLSQHAAEAHQIVSALAEQIIGECVREQTSETCTVDCFILAQHPRPLRREVFTRLWQQQAWPRQRMSFQHWDQLAELVDAGRGFSLPGSIEAKRRRETLTLIRASNQDDRKCGNFDEPDAPG